uniref:Transmembrane protein n=1 Tax=Panagrellus redivivus TaxID=6233 RepID=A0A7E4W0I5_PANRE
MSSSMFGSTSSPMVNLRPPIDQDELLNRVNSYVAADRGPHNMGPHPGMVDRVWRIGTPHRITVCFLLLLTGLVILVMYLDNDIANEPIYPMVVPMLFNFLLIGYYSFKYAVTRGLVTVHPTRRVEGISGFALAFALLLILSIATFEILLCLRLRGVSIPLIWVFVPFWIFASVSTGYLFKKILETHNKTD